MFLLSFSIRKKINTEKKFYSRGNWYLYRTGTRDVLDVGWKAKINAAGETCSINGLWDHSAPSRSQRKGFQHTTQKACRGLGSEETPCVSTKISKWTPFHPGLHSCPTTLRTPTPVEVQPENCISTDYQVVQDITKAKLSFLTAPCVICNYLKTKSGISGKDFGMRVHWAFSLLPSMVEHQ